MSEYILSKVEDKVATITLNRPEKLNAFTDEMLATWLGLLEEYRTSDAVNVIVITGAGRAFCTGGDVGTFDQHATNTAAGVKARVTDKVQSLALKLQEIDKPVIAAINGMATGAGMDVALMCDLRFAGRSARLAETYVRMGLLPGAGGAYYLPRIVGTAKAMELLLTGDWIEAGEAERLGLVNRVFEDDQLAEEVQKFARRLAGGPPLSVRLIKKIVYQGMDTDLRVALELVAANMPVVRMSEDHKEAVAAFREKRDAVFRGR